MLLRALLLLAGSLALWAGPALAERRVALVIGNAAYRHAQALQNPVEDARAVAGTLRKLDFEVILGTDLDKIGTEAAFKRFVQSLVGADVALLYYSGHAVQVDEQNHLFPVSANIRTLAELPIETIALDTVLAAMRENAKVQLLFLDACRNNPFAEQVSTLKRDGAGRAREGRGLASVPTSAGALFAFSTAPGKVALDGSGRLSPFTGSFVNRAVEPRVEIRQALTRIRADVIAETKGEQEPWDNSSLRSDFYFIPPKSPPLFDKLAFVRARPGAEGEGVPLLLAPPRQPEGGGVRVTLETPPRSGALRLAGRDLRPGETVDSGELQNLAYRPGRSGVVADAFSYLVEDDFGNRDVGVVTIALEAAPGPEASEAVASAGDKRFDLGRTEARGNSVLGLGPNLKLSATPALTARPDAAQAWLKLATAPVGGQLLVGGRRLDAGRAVPLADLPKLAFVPSIGREGKATDAVFTAEAPLSGEVRLAIDVDLHPCDRLAAHLFDTQGVTEGVPVEKLDGKAAAPACESAVRDHPEIGRFHSQLGRAYLALTRNAEAVRSFERAAALGHRRAAAVIGGFHSVGEFVAADLERTRALYEQASNAGDVVGSQALGQLYYDGRGVARDFGKARALFEEGARVGNPGSMNALGRMYSLGEGVAKDGAVARRFWEAAAARGDSYGVNSLGFVFLNGIGAKADPKQALALFKRAAAMGHPQAPNNVARLYQAGTGVPANLAEAVKWYRIGADRGDGWAALNMGDLHAAGLGGLKRDPIAAARFHARAAGLVQFEPAREGRALVAKLDGRTKQELLRSLLRGLGADSGAIAGEALLDRAAAVAVSRGAPAGSRGIDDVVVALAKAEWLALGARLDNF